MGDTYSYSQQMSDLEQYVVFVQETMLSVGLSILAVFFVVMLSWMKLQFGRLI